MNKDQLKGRIEEVKGKVKELVGNVLGNKSLEAKGLSQKVFGRIQAGYGDVKASLKRKL